VLPLGISGTELCSRKLPQEQWQEGIFSGTHGSFWDADGNLYVQDWNVSGRIMKLVRVGL